MKIEYADLVYLNRELKKRGTRYHIAYKNEDIACLEPPGECCLTEKEKRTPGTASGSITAGSTRPSGFPGTGCTFPWKRRGKPGKGQTAS